MVLKNWFHLAIILTTFNTKFYITETATYKHKSFPMELQTFVLGLISNHFQDCTVIHADMRSPKSLNWRSILVEDLLVSSTKTIPQQLILFPSANLSPNVLLMGKDALKKHTSFCKLLIVTLTQTRIQPFVKTFTNTFIPFRNEITERDQDHYVFIVDSEETANEILSSTIRFQLRFKIILYPRKLNSLRLIPTDLGVRTSCIYCAALKNVLIPSNPSLELSKIFPDFTLNFHQYPIRVAGPTKYIPVLELQKIDTNYHLKRGVHKDLFIIIAKKLNMSYTLKPCSPYGKIPEGSSGVWYNGTWAGCMGDAIRNISDIFLSVSYDHRRYPDADFSAAFGYSFVCFAIAKPELFYSWTVIFTAFVPLVWLLLATSLILITLVSHQIDRVLIIDNFLHKTPHHRIFGHMEIFRTGMYLLGYLLSQDVPPPKQNISSKFTFILWLYYGLVVSAVYGCSLQALIVSPGMEYGPRTFSELLHSKHYKWGASSAFRSGLGEQIFKSSENPVMQNIYSGMEGDKSSLVCNTRAARGKYACFNWEMFHRFIFQVNFLDKSGNHPFQVSRESTFIVPLSWMTQKREIFRKNVDKYLARSFDSGLATGIISWDWREYRKNWKKSSLNEQKGHSENLMGSKRTEKSSSFGLDKVKGSFYIYVVGILVSGMGFVFERVRAAVLRKDKDSIQF